MPIRAADLFAKLAREGLRAVDDLIRDRAAEQQFLDFKGARDGPGISLCENDSKTLAKAISGFANADGGVIVWGVDCRKQNGREEPVKKPLADAVTFRKKIEESLSRLTIPVHIGIENHEVLESTAEGTNESRGFVVTFIPPSQITPIRSRINDQETYFVRVGDSFVPAPHSALLWMFGRRPKGVHWIQFANLPVTFEKLLGNIHIPIGLGLANGGATFLERPYVSVQPLNFYTSAILKVDALGTAKCSHSFTGNWQVYTRSDDVVVPGGCVDICTIGIAIHPGTAAEADVEFELTFGALDAEPRRAVVRCSRAKFDSALSKIRARETVLASQIFPLDDIIRETKALVPFEA